MSTDRKSAGGEEEMAFPVKCCGASKGSYRCD